MTFDNEDVVDKICEIHFHEINGELRSMNNTLLLPTMASYRRLCKFRVLHPQINLCDKIDADPYRNCHKSLSKSLQIKLMVLKSFALYFIIKKSNRADAPTINSCNFIIL